MEIYKSVPRESDVEGKETDISWGNHGGMRASGTGDLVTHLHCGYTETWIW